jgi:hypothetical protein
VGKLVDIVSIVLLIGAAAAFVLGLRSIAEKEDIIALYWLIVGALALRSATDILRPRSSSQ